MKINMMYNSSLSKCELEYLDIPLIVDQYINSEIKKYNEELNGEYDSDSEISESEVEFCKMKRSDYVIIIWLIDDKKYYDIIFA